MEVTAGEPIREECLKGRLNRFGGSLASKAGMLPAPVM
jgi:hypothetical protein